MKEKKDRLALVAPIKETTADLIRAVKIDETVLRDVTDGDDHPEFVVVEFEESKSANNVYYDKAFFTSLVEQVNTSHPAGYLGHKHYQGLDKEDLLPDPQVVWLGATLDTSGSKAKAVIKGYLIPSNEGGKARAWIKRSAVNSVSWSADAVLTLSKDGSYRVKEFFLESIDFARKNRAGVKSQRLTVVTEMEGSEKVDEDEKTVDKIVGQLTLAELRQYNPGLVTVIKEMGKDEVKEETATAVAAKENELVQKHEKEIEQHPEITMMQKIKQLLGIEDDPNAKPDEVLVSMIERLDDMGKQVVKDWFKTEVLDKKIGNEKARAVVGRLINVTEMAGDFRSEKGIEKVKTSLAEKADDLIENDDTVQAVIKEMGVSRGGPRFSGGHRQSDDNSSSNSTGDDRFKNVERSGNLKVETVDLGR